MKSLISQQYKVNYFTEHLQIRNSILLFYSLPTAVCPKSYTKFEKPTYSGLVTTGSQKRIKKAMDILLQISPTRKVFNPIIEKNIKHRISIITLTIPPGDRKLTPYQGHKLLLAPWLLKMKRKHGLCTYIWKAEFQKNGMLHYHITTPSWIFYQYIQDEWNNLMSKNQLLTQHFATHNNQMPPSCQVAKVRNVKNIQCYLAKYLAKAEQGLDELYKERQQYLLDHPEIDPKTLEPLGKIWDCSENLKAKKFFSVDVTNEYIPELAVAPFKQCDRVSILFDDNPTKYLPSHIKNQYDEFIKTIRSKGIY